MFCVLKYENKNFPEPVEKVKIGGNEIKELMAKMQNLSEIQPEIAFTEFGFYQQYVPLNKPI